MSRGLPCCGSRECECDSKGRSPDHPEYKAEELFNEYAKKLTFDVICVTDADDIFKAGLIAGRTR